jgi:hypothetical protein
VEETIRDANRVLQVSVDLRRQGINLPEFLYINAKPFTFEDLLKLLALSWHWNIVVELDMPDSTVKEKQVAKQRRDSVTDSVFFNRFIGTSPPTQ